MKVNHLLTFYLYLITKGLIYVESWNGCLQANHGPSAKKKTKVGQIRNPFSEIIWGCYHQLHLQQFYHNAPTSQL